MTTYVADKQPQCPGCGAASSLALLPDGWYRCVCRQEFEWPYPPSLEERQEKRIEGLEQALRKIRELCVYKPASGLGADPRFAMNAREVVAIVDAAWGGG